MVKGINMSDRSPYKVLSIKEIVDIHKNVKRNTIYMLKMKGLSFSEISRRLGGSTKPVLIKIFKKMEKGYAEEDV